MKAVLDLSQIFNQQRILDKHIHANHNINYQKVDEELHLALAVELSEFANELRCFKFWSNKPMSDRNVVLEEYVDGIHFITALSLAYEVEPNNFIIEFTTDVSKHNLTIMLNNLYCNVGQIKDKESIKKWYSNYLSLGMSLGFTFEEILNAYTKKNEVNHKRQDTNY